jgi:uncharacterized protein
MPQVISDSSTLIHLAAINRFDLLRSYYPSIIIPNTVYREVVITGINRKGAEKVSAGINQGEIIVIDVKNFRLSASLQNEIHPGEADVIALATEMDDPILLLDDHDARRVAARFLFKYTGILGILIRAKNDKKISSLRDEIEQLRSVGRFWISDLLMHKALISVGEE